MKILLIEDSVVDVEFVRRTMDSSGESYELVVADDGKKAINLLEQQDQPYDVIVLDINLPKYNGHDVLEFIKGLPYYANTPVLMASTSSDKFDIGEAKRLGANGYLVKGKAFDVRELRNFLQQDELEWLEITE